MIPCAWPELWLLICYDDHHNVNVIFATVHWWQRSKARQQGTKTGRAGWCTVPGGSSARSIYILVGELYGDI
jgi:hypothetical protein